MDLPTQDLPEDEAGVRAFNARMAGAYDAITYDPLFPPDIEPERLFGLAGLYGCAPPAGKALDVLDIGSGVGSMLRHLAQKTSGTLVGIDLSPAACERARAALAPEGDRARIVCADVLDIEAEALGQADLIYCAGVLLLVPTMVRRRILDLAAQCLRPGGLLVINAYAGTMPAIMGAVARVVRGTVDPALDSATRIAQARLVLDQLKAQYAGTQPLQETLREATDILSGFSDVTLFHELLTAITPVPTTEIEARLAPAGIHYLGYLNQAGPRFDTSRQRALAADVQDLLGGGYRFTLYAKPVKESRPIPLPLAPVRWTTGLKPEGEVKYGEPVHFADPAKGSLDLHHPLVQAAIVAIGLEPLSYDQMIQRAQVELAAKGVFAEIGSELIVERDLEVLRRHNLVMPVGG